MGGHIEQGNFDDTNLDGLDWVVLMSWPGQVHEGNGTQIPAVPRLQLLDRLDVNERAVTVHRIPPCFW
jgi:Protein of unknown function (DUF1326)